MYSPISAYITCMHSVGVYMYVCTTGVPTMYALEFVEQLEKEYLLVE